MYLGKRRDGSRIERVPVAAEVAENVGLSHGAFRLYALLLLEGERRVDREQRDPRVNKTMKELAGRLGASEETARRWVRELQAAGLLDVGFTAGRGRANTFLVWPTPQEASR